MFVTEDALQSLPCQYVLGSDFRAHCYGTDMIERLNSQYTAQHPIRAPGRNSINAEFEHFLDQVSNIHKSNGGVNPTAVTSLRASASKEVISCMPLLDGAPLGSMPLLAAVEDAPMAPGLDAIEDAPA
eukprot:6125253-Pyramimonas_sp.AAC.1